MIDSSFFAIAVRFADSLRIVAGAKLDVVVRTAIYEFVRQVRVSP